MEWRGGGRRGGGGDGRGRKMEGEARGKGKKREGEGSGGEGGERKGKEDRRQICVISLAFRLGLKERGRDESIG